MELSRGLFWPIAGSILLSGLNLCGAWHPWLELNRNLSAYYLLAHGLCLGALLARRRWLRLRRWKLALAALGGMMAWYGAQIWPFYCARPERAGGPRLKILAADLNYREPAVDGLLREIRDSAPDVAGVVGLTPAADARIAALFPYKAGMESDPRAAVYSRRPVSLGSFEFAEEALPPGLAAVVQGPDGRPLKLILVRGAYPWENGLQVNRIVLRRAATAARRSPGDVVVAGPLNITPFSGLWGMFEEGAGLKSAAWGFGLRRTWRADSWFLRFSFDHILYRGSLTLCDFRVLADIGAGHLPVMAEFGRG